MTAWTRGLTNDIQRRLSIFNEKQGLDDLALDKKLKICRGC